MLVHWTLRGDPPARALLALERPLEVGGLVCVCMSMCTHGTLRTPTLAFDRLTQYSHTHRPTQLTALSKVPDA